MVNAVVHVCCVCMFVLHSPVFMPLPARAWPIGPHAETGGSAAAAADLALSGICRVPPPKGHVSGV